MSLATERIGVEFTTNEGYQVIVIDYVTCEKVQVMFLDDYKYTTWTTWGNLKNGCSLKNPFHKSVYGVGYLGIMSNGEVPKTSMWGSYKREKVREYQVWQNMIERVYSDNIYFTYENVTVCDRWHNYSLFLEDLPKIKNYEYWKNNPKQKIALNKDMYYTELGIITDKKIYSLETTRFITDSENMKEVHDRKELKN